MQHLLMDYQAIAKALARIAHEIIEKQKGDAPLALIGIKKGGMNIAGRLFAKLREFAPELALELGFVDPSGYRDDLGAEGNGGDPRLGGNEIDFSLEGKRVILVDDVLASGRTVRSALVALAQLGSPRSIELAVFVNRGKRELPIVPDYVGKNVPTAPSDKVVIRIAEEVHPDEKIYLRPWQSDSSEER